MKHCGLLVLCLILSCTRLQAQGSFSNTGSGLNDMSRYMDDEDSTEIDEGDEEYEEEGTVTAAEDPFDAISMDATDSLLSFDNLPEKGNVVAFITDSNGEEISAKDINPRKNEIDIHKLPKDLLYVTLTFRNKRKAFTLDRSEDDKKSGK